MCRTFPGRTPAQIFGLWDEVVALDFDCAAAWVFRRGEDRKAFELAKAQAVMMWGTGDVGETTEQNLQQRANEFFS